MDTISIQKQEIIQTIDALPDNLLGELSSFIDYLRYKSTTQLSENSSSSAFLLSISALGASAENNVSERDEEILADEVDPIRGWSLHPEQQV